MAAAERRTARSRDAVRARRRLRRVHAANAPAAHDRPRKGEWRSGVCGRLSARTGASVSGGTRRRARGVRHARRARHSAERHRARRRLCRGRARALGCDRAEESGRFGADARGRHRVFALDRPARDRQDAGHECTERRHARRFRRGRERTKLRARRRAARRSACISALRRPRRIAAVARLREYGRNLARRFATLRRTRACGRYERGFRARARHAARVADLRRRPTRSQTLGRAQRRVRSVGARTAASASRFPTNIGAARPPDPPH